MAENKFIERLQGKGTEKSVVEIKNTATPTMFTNMPAGDSNDFNTYSDHRGNATVVANGTMNWKVDTLQTLTPANIVNGNGQDFTTSIATSGAGLWINAEYTFPSTGDPNHPVAMVFNPQTKWVLKVCGDNLLSPTSNTIDFTVLITFGSNNLISKTFTVAEQANKFCKEFVIDFAESNTNIIKAQGLSTMKLQLLCGTADASANIYGGMTVLTCLQRKVEAVAISSTFANVEEVLRDGILPSDYFNNAAYIAQVTDGDTAYAVFQRDGDEMLFVGWHQPIPDQTGNSGKFLTTDGSLMSWAQITISDVDSLQTELNDLQNQIDDLSGRGRFLSVWNCATGLAETNPPESPYTYKAGDYFIVGVVSTATPAVNYKPDGSSYTTGVPSTTVETDEVAVDDTYFYDGTTWKLQSNSNKTVTFSNIAGDIYDNASATTALNAKQDTLTAGTNINITGTTISATDTTYTGSDGITLTGTNFTNSGVRGVASGTANGTISVNTNGTSADVAVTGLGSAAYTASGDYATAAQGTLASTALQPGDDITDLNNDAGYQTAGDVATAISGKQDTLTAGTNITITGTTISATDTTYSDFTGATAGDAGTNGLVPAPAAGDQGKFLQGDGMWASVDALPSQSGQSGKFLTTDGTDASWATISAVPDIDNSTITKNSSDELQAVATVNANTSVGATNPVYDWVGTLAEYNAQDIENQHPDWMCYITDDVSGGTSVYTKSEVDTIASGKANVALDNITNAGKEVCANMAMPSARYTALTLGASGSTYTAPADGYVCFYMAQPGSHDLQVYLSNETAQVKVRTYQNVNDIACWIPVSKGDRFYLEYTYNSGSYQFRFIYANGAQ